MIISNYPGELMKKTRVILYQKSLAIDIPEEDIIEMKDYKPHFVCLPEYFFSTVELGNFQQTAENQEQKMELMKDLSAEIDTVLIGGTMPELCGNKIYNTTFIYNRGKFVGSYRKKNLFFAEEGKTTPGDSFSVFSAYGYNFGVLICADIFDDSSFDFMRKNRARIIFSPTFSLKKNETVENKYQRDLDIYVRGASLSNSVIVKVCGVKSGFKPFLQARSLIADSNEVLYRVKPEEEESEMIIKKEINI